MFGRTSCCEGDKIDVVFVVEKLLKSDVGRYSVGSGFHSIKKTVGDLIVDWMRRSWAALEIIKIKG